MKLSTKGRYGARAMLDLALHTGNGKTPVLLRDIAERQDISDKYLEHIFTPLRQAGLVRGVRGAKGGYFLGKSPAKITLSEIVFALEGEISPVECLSNKSFCSRAEACVTKDIWQDLKKTIEKKLGSITLAEMVKKAKAKQQAGGLTYHI